VYDKFCKQFPGVEKFQVAESRMETIKYEIKESALLRRLDFNLEQALKQEGERQIREAYIEKAFERLYRLKLSFMAAYSSLPQILAAEEVLIKLQTPPEIVPEPSPAPVLAHVLVPMPLPELVQSAKTVDPLAQLQRLAILLEIKRQALELLTSILLEFAREVTK
jgi:hypothetical protein